MLTTGYTGWGLLVLFLSCFGAVVMAVTKEESTAACFGAIICCITIIVGIMFIFNAIPDANVRAPPCPRVCLFTTPAPANVRQRSGKGDNARTRSCRRVLNLRVWGET